MTGQSVMQAFTGLSNDEAEILHQANRFAEKIPCVRLSGAAMQAEQDGFVLITPVEVVEFEAVEGDGARLGPGTVAGTTH